MEESDKERVRFQLEDWGGGLDTISAKFYKEGDMSSPVVRQWHFAPLPWSFAEQNSTRGREWRMLSFLSLPEAWKPL
jgi:hypothetical protein